MSLELEPLLRDCDPVSPEESEKIIIFSTKSNIYYTYLHTFFAHLASNNQISTLFLFYYEKLSQIFPSLTIQGLKVSNSWVKKNRVLYDLKGGFNKTTDWHVNFNNERLSPESLPNLNFFRAFEAILRLMNRKYSLKYRTPKNKHLLKEFIQTCNLSLMTAQNLLNYARTKDKKIFLACWDRPYPPHSIFLEYCREMDVGEHLNYLHLGTLYDSYYKADNEEFGNEICISNFSRRKAWNPFEGWTEEFDESKDQYEENIEFRQKLTDEVKTMLDEKVLKGNKSWNLPASSENIDRKVNLGDLNRSPKSVYCLFAHVPFETGLRDRSEIFNNRNDWIKKTISLFKKKEDYLLLKPHPRTYGFENHDYLIQESLESRFYNEVSNCENIFLLEPKKYRPNQIYDILDCGLIWTSSVGLEMIYCSIPVINAGLDVYYSDYVPLPMPDSWVEYRSLIDNYDQINVTQENIKRVRLFYYLLKNKLHIDFPYLQGICFPDESYMKENLNWEEENIREYLKNGDHELKERLVQEL